MFPIRYFIQISYFPMLVHHHTQVYCLYSLLTPQYIIMFTIPRRLRKLCANSQHLGIFFKTNVTQSIFELILYSQKAQNCGHFLSNLANLLKKALSNAHDRHALIQNMK